MKTINDLDLKAKDKAKVRAWLTGIMHHFERMSAGERETVERYNFDNLDFFYFTDCRDILSKNPESKGVEDADTIRKRKKAVEYKLIFQSLLGKKLGRKRPCSHCGNDDRIIDSFENGTGHYLFCRKCGMTTIVTYPIGYGTCIKILAEKLQLKHKVDLKKFLPIKDDEKHECCGKCNDSREQK